MSGRVEIIAELANAHQGDPQRALELARAALSAGADAVKFQIYFAEELLVTDHPKFRHFQELAFSRDAWRQLLREVRGAGGRVYCDVFGRQALDVASEAQVAGLKIHSSDLGNAPLLHAAAAQPGVLLLAVGGSTIHEIARAVDIVARPAGPRPVLLHGFQSYPTALEDTHLERLEWLRRIFGARCEVGYMDHVDAEDPFAMLLPLLAIGSGARMVEKHVTLDRAARGIDYYSSLNPGEFARFVQIVRRAEQAFGEDPERFSEAERRYRIQMKKHWVTASAMQSGDVIRPADVVMKRAQSDFEVAELEQLVGRPLLNAQPAEHVLSRADVSQQVWALVVARMRSCRLPGKALLEVAGMPALAHLLERLKQARHVHRIVLCTTTEPDDHPIAELGARCGVSVCRGPSEDVLARMLGAIDGHAVDEVLRVTGDDILVDPEYVDRAVDHHLRTNAQYTDAKTLPSGTEVEVFDSALLRLLAAAAKDSSGTEYLTSYVVHHPDQFKIAHCPVDAEHRRDWRLTLDTPEDLDVLRTFLAAMRDEGKALTYRLADVVRYFSTHAGVLGVNAHVRQRQTPPEVCTELVWTSLSPTGASMMPGGER